MDSFQKLNPSSPRRRFRPKPKWAYPGKAWEPRRGNRRQERKYRQPRALSIHGEWHYSRNRTERRDKRIRRGARSLVTINRRVNRFWARIARWLGIQYRPERIDPDLYTVEHEFDLDKQEAWYG